jgi:N-methylhydantoinase B
MPFVKIFKRGVQDPELTAIIRANCRVPERAMGDFRAQVAAIRTGERRLLQVLHRYGNAAFEESIQRIYDQSERLARASVRAIPDGVYLADSFMDDDGVTFGKHIPLHVRVVVQDDEMTVDLSGVSPQVAGYFNSGPSAGRSAVEVAFKMLTSPLLLPINHGSFRPVKIVLPPGRVVSASKPAAVRAWMTIPMTLVDTILKAMAEPCPDRVWAGGHDDLAGGGTYAYIDPRTGALVPARGEGVGLAGGGFGAVSDADGQCATVCLNDGDTHNSPVEAGEAKAPFVVRSRSLRQDSGGPGRFRGGLGVVQDVETLVPAMFQARVERSLCAPWGLLGGSDGLANKVALVVRGGQEWQEFPTGKIAPTPLQAGDRYVTLTGGGGGFWSALERDPEAVLHDVRNGYVSLEAARRDYGVIIHQPSPRVFALDRTATEALRASMARCQPACQSKS